MPAWQGEPKVDAHIVDLYAYLAARAEGFAAYGAFAPSLKAPGVADWLSTHLAAAPPVAILNATAFSAKSDNGATPFDVALCPVFQVALSTNRRRDWAASDRGLSPADLAMHVVLPEVDGRLFAGLISHKSPGKRHPDLQFSRFAHRAEREDMVVIDDPVSILRCTNKIDLHDRLRSLFRPTPRTEIVFRDDARKLEALPDLLGLPIVLKIPDGSFSRGIHKVETPEQLKAAAEQLFQHTALLLAQEYLYTEFDWRIGVLDGEPLYACQYFMSRGHWQIYDHAPKAGAGKGTVRSGGFKTLPIREAPSEVVRLATRASNAIGNGLYGVDLKMVKDRTVIIEVNDNPSIDAGVEDAYLGEDLYRRIMSEFLRRLERKRLGVRD